MKSNKIKIDGKSLKTKQVFNIVKKITEAELSQETLEKSKEGQKLVEDTINSKNKIVYGINTGFGPMANYILATNQILELQENLITSHATGIGEYISSDFVHAAMVVRLNTLAKGNSGVSSELLEQLKTFINEGIIPCVPRHGAVGTSGDLVQLAHIALALIGKGKVNYHGKIEKTEEVLNKLNLKKYSLKPKEGLALINGTSLMTGIASLLSEKSKKLLGLSVLNGSMALEIIKAYEDGFSEQLQNLRPHEGQIEIAKKIREILKDSTLIRGRHILEQHANTGNQVSQINEQVQEVYSFRCIPQILGPAYEIIKKISKTTEIELNSVTDNPIIDWQNKTFLHGGNFHGDYISVAMDELKMSVVKITMLSERRINFFLNDKVNGKMFPPFLNLHTPGLTLGLQPLQFVATSTTAHSQTLAYPMNLHSISTNADNQDIVSMGTDSALITSEVVENAFIVQVVELITLCQAVDVLKIESKISKKLQELYKRTRQEFKTIIEDREAPEELEKLLQSVKEWEILDIFEIE